MMKALLEAGAIFGVIDWGGFVRVFVIQAAVLLIILIAAIRYIDWALDAAQEEFMNAGIPTEMVPQARHPTNSFQLRCNLRKPI